MTSCTSSKSHFSRAFFVFLTVLTSVLSLISNLRAADAQIYGPITIDGTLSDWNKVSRLDFPPLRTASDEVYGSFAANAYLFAIKSNGLTAGSTLTFWINSDRNSETGFKIFGFAGGVELKVEVTIGVPGGQVYLVDALGVTTPSGIGIVSASTGGAVEIALPTTISTDAKGVNVLAQTSTNVFLPADFSQGQYFQEQTARPLRTNPSKRLAIVYSSSTAAKFFDLKAYSQLFMSTQHQAMMAGVPFDLIGESELADVANLVNYDVIVTPYISNIPATSRAKIEDALRFASYRYGIGIIAAGDFITNDATGSVLAGDPYQATKAILGVSPQSGGGPINYSTVIATSAHTITRDYSPNETITSYSGGYFRSFAPFGTTQSTVLVNQNVSGTLYPAVLATQTGGRNVFFTTDRYLGDANLLWPAIRWAIYGDAPQIALQMGRQKNLFVARNDMDQSQFADEFSTVNVPLKVLLDSWKSKYNFVGSYYVNVGDSPYGGPFTNWALSAPYYNSLIAAENEVGNHSYSHPDDTNVLTDSQYTKEFGTSRTELQTRIGRQIPGIAVPGAPDTYATALKILRFANSDGYVSGGFSGFNAGYPGAFGFINDSSSAPYLSPNMTFDFTIIEFLRGTPAQATAQWAAEYEKINRHASQPIVHWPWHDYGPTSSLANGYSIAMYESLISKAAADNAEFLTAIDLTGRLNALQRSSVTVTQNGNTLTANISGSDLGSFSLLATAPNSSNVIQNVSNWYAFSNDRVFLPKNGGSFAVKFGASQDNVTHISKLPMRSKLISAVGDGKQLTFSFEGAGSVQVTLQTGNIFSFTGAQGVSVTGNIATLSFSNPGTYTVSITATTPTATPTATATATSTVTVTPTITLTLTPTVTPPLAVTPTPTMTATRTPTSLPSCGDGLIMSPEGCDDGNLTIGDGCSATCTVEAGYTCIGTPSRCSLAAVSSTKIAITSSANEDGWVLANPVLPLVATFEQGGSGASALRVGDDARNRTYRSILSFNTAPLPDNAIVDDATLEIRRGTDTGSDPFTTLGNVAVDIRSGYFGTRTSLDTLDYVAAANVRAATFGTQGPRGTLHSVALNAAALTFVNTKGRTQLRLGFTTLSNGDRRNNFAGFYSADAVAIANRPVLRVSYHLPAGQLAPAQTKTPKPVRTKKPKRRKS